MVPVVCIIGWSGSGKTSLIEGLLEVFRGRGRKVGVIKHHPHRAGSLPPGKDTTRYLEAGAGAALLLGPGGYELIVTREGEPPLDEVLALFWGYDLVLAEGFKGSDYPKIEVFGGSEEGPLYKVVKGVIALVSDQISDPSLPCFRTHQVEALADFIEDRFLRSSAKVSLLADGKVVGLNRFVSTLIGGVIEAMVRPLKGCEGVREVIIRWKA